MILFAPDQFRCSSSTFRSIHDSELAMLCYTGPRSIQEPSISQYQRPSVHNYMGLCNPLRKEESIGDSYRAMDACSALVLLTGKPWHASNGILKKLILQMGYVGCARNHDEALERETRKSKLHLPIKYHKFSVTISPLKLLLLLLLLLYSYHAAVLVAGRASLSSH